MTLSLPPSSSTAYLLVTHGSRDPRPAIAAQRLAQAVADEITHYLERSPSAPTPLVGTACLEFAPTALHEQIVAFGDRALTLGYQDIMILPLFLLPGVHVREDIPEQVMMAKHLLNNRIGIHVCPYLGSNPDLTRVIKGQIESMPATQTILLAHGSRRPGGNQPIDAIATQLGILPAYWSVSPSLKDQIHDAIQQGYRHITVIPYFLFAGGITDAIAQTLEDIDQRHPGISLTLGQPLIAQQAISTIIAESIGSAHQNLVLSL